MRCIACNKALSDSEATRKHVTTGEYIDMCNNCLREVIAIEPIPLSNFVSIYEDYEGDDDAYSDE